MEQFFSSSEKWERKMSVNRGDIFQFQQWKPQDIWALTLCKWSTHWDCYKFKKICDLFVSIGRQKINFQVKAKEKWKVPCQKLSCHQTSLSFCLFIISPYTTSTPPSLSTAYTRYYRNWKSFFCYFLERVNKFSNLKFVHFHLRYFVINRIRMLYLDKMSRGPSFYSHTHE